uniref:polynucleotide adenylyltransferase n=1 Tax=Parascaris univalens TaxID=6257 RepID=A0A914ZPG8_PARUN
MISHPPYIIECKGMIGESKSGDDGSFCSSLYRLWRRFISARNVESEDYDGRDLRLTNQVNIIENDHDTDSADEFLVLASLASAQSHCWSSDQSCCWYEPRFVLKTCCLPRGTEKLSPWSAAIRRRRIERHSRSSTPFIRYDQKFLERALAEAALRSVSHGREEVFGSKETSLSARTPSPAPSCSALSSTYSSDELETSCASCNSHYSSLFSPSDVISQENESSSATTPFPLSEGCNVELSAVANFDMAQMLKPSSIFEEFCPTWEHGSDEILDNLGVEDVRLHEYVERAFKHSRIFEILSQASNRFCISPSSFGLGIPLCHLNRCWPPIVADSDARRCFPDIEVPPKFIKVPSFHPRKKKRHNAGAEKLCVARNVSDGQGIESLYWHSNEPLVHARSQSSGDYRDGVLSSSTDNASQGEAVLSAARMSSPTGVVAVDGAVDREESLEEQLVDVVELADPQPAPVNASAANAPRPLRPPPASSFSRSGRFEVSKMDVLSEEIWDFHNTITQSEALLNRKLHLRDMLYCCISPVFPMCGLYVVGSSLNGFGNNSSDMDLCLMISHKDIDQRTDAVVVLGMIKSALINVAWVREQQLIIAKVPILRIKFTEPFTEITVDLNANNSVAIRNTHLLCYYSSFDWRVRPLVSVVKEWAKRRDMNDANRSTFTSYSLVLMVIHYLQCGANPAVLPSLQELYPKRFNHRIDVRTLNVSVPLEPPATGEWQFSEANTLGELLLGFLEYYAFKFDYVHDAISVRLGTKIERSFVARQRSPYNNSIAQWNCICIEEPFTLSNTAHSVHSQMVFDAIREAFVEGFEELDTNRDLNAFLNAPPIKIGANITPHGSGSHLNVLSVTSTDHAGELASCGRMLRRCRNAGDALFVLDTGISESSGHSSALSSPRSTPSSIGEHSCVASSESTDGDLVRSFNDRIIASDQECDGNYAQRERRILATIPPETANASSVLLGERQQEKDVDEARKFGDEKSTKEAKSGNDSQGQMQQQQGRGRRRRNARKIQPSINDYTTARLVEANSGGSVRLGKKPFCSLEAHSS